MGRSRLTHLKLGIPICKPQTRFSVTVLLHWIGMASCGLILALAFTSGCLPQQRGGSPSPWADRLRPKPIQPGPNGLMMDVIFLERPFGDQELNRDLWACADEEALDMAGRRSLEQHGFRIATLGGPIPAALKTLFKEEEVGQSNGEHLQIQSGSPTQIQTSGIYPTWPSEADGAEDRNQTPYMNAVGTLRTIPRITSDGCISLAVTPEIQHGDPRRTFVSDDDQQGPLNWAIQVGRQSRMFDGLSFSLRLHSGQYAILSCRASDRDSLGARFFTRVKDGQTMQRVVLIQAEPSRDALAARLQMP